MNHQLSKFAVFDIVAHPNFILNRFSAIPVIFIKIF